MHLVDIVKIVSNTINLSKQFSGEILKMAIYNLISPYKSVTKQLLNLRKEEKPYVFYHIISLIQKKSDLKKCKLLFCKVRGKSKPYKLQKIEALLSNMLYKNCRVILKSVGL